MPSNVSKQVAVTIGDWADINSPMDLAKRVAKRLTDFSGLIRLCRVIKLNHVDVIHAHQYSAAIPAVCAAQLTGCRVVYTTHVRESWRTKFVMDSMFARWTDKIVAVSENDKEFLIKNKGLPSENIVVIKNGIDPTPYLGIGTRAHLVNTPPVIGAVGRLHEQKGHIYLIRAIRQLIDDGLWVSGFIAGSGPLQETLQLEIDRLRLTGIVRLLGHRTDVASLLNACDIFAQPSLYEGLPLSVLEAMAAARPVVATQVDGIPEAVEHGVTGLLVPTRDVQALALGLAQLVRDPDLRMTFGSNARERVLQEFQLTQMGAATEQMYASLGH